MRPGHTTESNSGSGPSDSSGVHGYTCFPVIDPALYSSIVALLGGLQLINKMEALYVGQTTRDQRAANGAQRVRCNCRPQGGLRNIASLQLPVFV